MATSAQCLNACADTCVLINFAIVSRMDLLARISDLAFHVPREVLDEVTVAEQRQRVETLVASGGIRMARIEAVDELRAFAEYVEQFGRGESAC